jgi:hypothetical protein
MIELIFNINFDSIAEGDFYNLRKWIKRQKFLTFYGKLGHLILILAISF